MWNKNKKITKTPRKEKKNWLYRTCCRQGVQIFENSHFYYFWTFTWHFFSPSLVDIVVVLNLFHQYVYVGFLQSLGAYILLVFSFRFLFSICCENFKHAVFHFMQIKNVIVSMEMKFNKIIRINKNDVLVIDDNNSLILCNKHAFFFYF